MLLWLGLAVRALLLGVGQWQDAHSPVKYTDIDYEVYTDAAGFLARGGSPYQRSTYRYTPLLAAALVPNATLHKAFGKLLFCGADLLAAWLLGVLMRRRGASPRLRAAGVGLWLFSPFTVAISTRGNGEALVTCMLLGMLAALEAGRLPAAALLFGVAVHWRLYPIIFALPLLRHFALQRQAAQASGAADEQQPDGDARLEHRHGGGASTRRQQAQRQQRPQAGSRSPRLWQGWRRGWGLGPLAAATWRGLASPAGAAFGALSGAAFLGLGAACCRLYGWPFLHETYLYHLSRTDPRHNFSPYFYAAYLASGGAAGAARWDVGWAFSAAQLALQAAVGWRCAADLPFCFLLQTAALVAFNKVSTAQYFVWYISFLPLVLPDLAAAPNRRRLAAAGGAWGAGMVHWLLWAFMLEFRGRPVHLAVWAASLAFFAAHVWLVCELAATWRHKEAGVAGARAGLGRRPAKLA